MRYKDLIDNRYDDLSIGEMALILAIVSPKFLNVRQAFAKIHKTYKRVKA